MIRTDQVMIWINSRNWNVRVLIQESQKAQEEPSSDADSSSTRTCEFLLRIVPSGLAFSSTFDGRIPNIIQYEVSSTFNGEILVVLLRDANVPRRLSES